MMYREIIAVYSQIHTKHLELLNIKLPVHILTTVIYTVSVLRVTLCKLMRRYMNTDAESDAPCFSVHQTNKAALIVYSIAPAFF
jgi:hypothetical protein